MKITVIGAGNMGGATARGLLNAKAVEAQNLTIVDTSTVVRDSFAALGVQSVMGSAVNGVADADIVILAVKPWYMMSLVEEISSSIRDQNVVVVSLAAGVAVSELEQVLSCAVIRAIPNTAISVGESMTFLYSGSGVSGAQLDSVKVLFDSVGRTAVVDSEKTLDGGMALASCGLAYALRYVRAAMEGGVELGVAPAMGREVVAQTIKGAAELLLTTGNHPEVEIDKVTTPGGVTIKGLNAMEEHGFTNAVIQGIKASK